LSPATNSGQPLQYFIHDDSDALRMEIAGSLVGRAAQKAYEAWRSSSMTGRQPLVVDISYVTDADQAGRAVLRAWQVQGARIVASSFISRAIVNSTLSGTTGEYAQTRTAARL
jgi:predicted transcriptional regulator